MLQICGVGLLVGRGLALGLVVGAGAARSGQWVASSPTAAVAVGTVHADTPFASGQNINVVIPANSAFAARTPPQHRRVRCANGVIPTQTSRL